ncbi:MAG: FAD-dependent oxidoreductase, partial [Burkholderiales bacterium]
MSRHDSLWAATFETPLCAPLAGDVHVDVCLVGAGIAGLTTAYLLARAGRTVCILDDGDI